MAMMISWVAPVHPSHPYLENDPAPSFAPTICAFHLGFSLVRENEQVLREQLSPLTLEQFKDIVADYGMDPKLKPR